MNSGPGGKSPAQGPLTSDLELEADNVLLITVKHQDPTPGITSRPPVQAWTDQELVKKDPDKIKADMAAKVAPIDNLDVKGPGKNYLRPNDPTKPPSEEIRSSSKTDSSGTPATTKKDAAASRRGSLVHSVRHGVRHFMHWSGWYDSSFTVTVRRFIRGRAFAIVAMVCLMLALFLSDVFVLAQVSTNVEQDAILTFVFVVFAVEFFGLVLTDASYLFGFFFWMDLVGTISMIFDISYLLGINAKEPERRNTDSGRENLIVVRLARAAKLGARAGRLSRVLKLLRFLPFLYNSDQSSDNVKMARVISNQLTNVISTRVAFLSICIVIFLPFLGMWTYPEMDDSMGAWTQLLGSNAQDYVDERERAPQIAANLTAMQNRLTSELLRFTDFYKDNSYGPFHCCYGVKRSDDEFNCDPAVVTALSTPFTAPGRQSSIREVSQENFQASFDLSTPRQLEAAGNIILFVLIMLIMIVFGLVTSSSISVIALEPLERMLSMVREKCHQIFKYTSPLLEKDDEDGEEEDFDDMEHSSEFVILEKVVSKLAAIADLATTRGEPEVRENMDENEIMALNWMQGQPVVNPGGRGSKNAAAHRGSLGETPAMISQADTMSHPGEVEAPTPRENETSPEMSKMSIPEEVKESLLGELFDAFSLPKTATHKMVTLHIILNRDGCNTWLRSNVQESHLVKFVTNAEAGYMPNPWHNFSHALDTLYSVDRFMNVMEAHYFMSEVSQFWLMISAVGHDIGHTGVNNQFLVETADELALRYNDRSPLENMHCARLFQVISDPEANVFAQVDKDLYKEMRKGMINAILHTDVVKHNEMIKELNILYQMNSEVFDCPSGVSEELIQVLQTPANTQLMVNALLHCGDIGNPMKPWELCKSYADKILDEFFAQGDREKELGIPVQVLNDRDKVSRPNSQIGFIEFVIAGMAESMVNLFPTLDSLSDNLRDNVERWLKLWVESTEPSAEDEKRVTGRVSKVTAKLKAVMRGNRGSSECNQ